MSFPGGRVDPEDGTGVDGLIRTALREAEEETGLDPTGVEVFAVWPSLWVPVSNFGVSPVLGLVARAVAGRGGRSGRGRLGATGCRSQALADPAQPGQLPAPVRFHRAGVHWSVTCSSGVSPPVCSTNCCMLGGWARDWDPAHVVPLPDRLVEAAWRSEGRRSEDVRRLTAIEHDLGRPEGVE